MTGSVGFFGKLPGVGDFVQRRLPPAFVAAWDKGFEIAVAGTRAALGDGWHAAWQAAPVWRFALAPGVCGASAWAGATGPSVDRVGRGFPMVLASAVGATDDWIRIVREGANWFAELERVYRDVAANTSADAFDAAVQAVPDAAVWLVEKSVPQATVIDWAQGDVVRKPWQPGSEDRALATWASACAEAGNGCLWWTQGDAGMPPRALLTRGLPTAQAYTEFLVAGATTSQPAGAVVDRAVPEPWVVPGSGHPDSLLDDLLSDATVPAAIAVTTPPSWVEAAAIAAARVETVPASAAPATETARVAHGGRDATWWIAADNGPGDPRRQAAVRAEQVLAEVDDWVDFDAVRTRLLALHAPLRERSEDLIDPVAEDGAVVVARLDAGRAALLRVGAANAWHWRRGQLRPVFADAAVAFDRDATLRPGYLMDVLSAASAPSAGGLGAVAEPGCESVSCVVAAGDRLLLLATDTLIRLSAETLAASLAETTSEEARSRIAAAAGLGTDRAHWPLAVIEVGT